MSRLEENHGERFAVIWAYSAEEYYTGEAGVKVRYFSNYVRAERYRASIDPSRNPLIYVKVAQDEQA